MVFRSTDNGDTWRVSNTGLAPYWVRYLAVSADGMVYADAQTGPFRSTDGGETWHRPAATEFYGSNFVANSRNELFCKWYSVYRSTDNGVNWAHVSDGLWGEVKCLALNRDDYLYAGTELQGVFRTVGPTVSIDILPSALPRNYELASNYPNPFNPTTTIEYELPTSSVVKLSVYDLLGREVSVLVSERRESGVHEVKFMGRDFQAESTSIR
jgi:hypothetical protein